MTKPQTFNFKCFIGIEIINHNLLSYRKGQGFFLVCCNSIDLRWIKSKLYANQDTSDFYKNFSKVLKVLLHLQKEIQNNLSDLLCFMNK